MNKKLGKYIVFEGIDNSGKTTIATKTQQWLKSIKIDAVLTKHPGATEAGQSIRQLLKHSECPLDPQTQSLLFAADNCQFITQILKPMIEDGYWVIGDRNNYISSLAYQLASGCNTYELDLVHETVLCVDQPKIDILFLFHSDWDTFVARKQSSDIGDRYENGGKPFFDKLIQYYKSLNAANTKLPKFVNDLENIYHIDATKPLEDVLLAVQNILSAYIKSNY